MSRRGGLVAFAACAFAAAALAVLFIARPGARPERDAVVPTPSPGTPLAPDLPRPPAIGLQIPAPRSLGTDRRTVWSPVVAPAVVRSRPAATAPAVGRLARLTPERTTNIVNVLGRRTVDGVVWVRVQLAGLSAFASGWVRRAQLGGYASVDARLVVDLRRLRLTLLRGDRVVFTAPVGVGAERTPTPRGRFYVRNVLTRYASPFYGPVAFGTSARSRALTDWPAGGYIGIHGTDRPQLIPGRISHGCVRLRNADILRLARLLPIGTPLEIR